MFAMHRGMFRWTGVLDWNTPSISLMTSWFGLMVVLVKVCRFPHPTYLCITSLLVAVPAANCMGVSNPIRPRNIRTGRPAIANRLHIGEVVRFEARTFIHNLEGRKTNTWYSTMRAKGGHHEGRNYFAPSCIYHPPLPNIAA